MAMKRLPSVSVLSALVVGLAIGYSPTARASDFTGMGALLFAIFGLPILSIINITVLFTPASTAKRITLIVFLILWVPFLIIGLSDAHWSDFTDSPLQTIANLSCILGAVLFATLDVLALNNTSGKDDATSTEP